MILGTYKENSFELLTPGERRLELLNIEQKENNPDYIRLDAEGRPQNPYRWEWQWTIVAGQNADAKFKTWTNATISQGSTAAPIVEALLGHKLVSGESPSTDEIIGRQIDCYIANKNPKSSKEGNYIFDPRPVGPIAKHTTPPQAAIENQSIAPPLQGADNNTTTPTPNGGDASTANLRRFLIATAAIRRAKPGLSMETITRRLAEEVGDPTPFKDLPDMLQNWALGWLEGIVADPDNYDTDLSESDVPF